MIRTIKTISHTVDYFFFAVTGFSFAKTVAVLIDSSADGFLSIDKIGSLVVSIFAILFWIGRYFIMKRKDEKEQRKIDLEIELIKKKLDNENSDSNRTL